LSVCPKSGPKSGIWTKKGRLGARISRGPREKVHARVSRESISQIYEIINNDGTVCDKHQFLRCAICAQRGTKKRALEVWHRECYVRSAQRVARRGEACETKILRPERPTSFCDCSVSVGVFPHRAVSVVAVFIAQQCNLRRSRIQVAWPKACLEQQETGYGSWKQS
jgi:hypothetical protein